MGYNSLISALIQYEKHTMILEWESGLRLEGNLDTVFETSNENDEDALEFVDYDAAVFKVSRIVTHPMSLQSAIYRWLVEEGGRLIEVSLYKDPPSSICLADGQKVWSRSE